MLNYPTFWYKLLLFFFSNDTNYYFNANKMQLLNTTLYNKICYEEDLVLNSYKYRDNWTLLTPMFHNVSILN